MANQYDILNKQVANWTVLFMKLHNYHWYVKGEQFFTLHEKFEELYDEAAEHIDDLAERLLAVGGQPIAKLSECLDTASVKEATGNETAQQMVQAIAEDFGTMIGELKEGIALAANDNDLSTEDLLLGIYASVEKHKWMLDAFAGK